MFRTATFALVATALVACAAQDGTSADDPTGAGDGKADQAIPYVDAATKQAAKDAVAAYVKTQIGDQVATLANPSVRISTTAFGEYAFVRTGVTNEIDWTKTSLAAEVEAGVFDGPHVEALLRRQPDGSFIALTGAIGATDVWWAELYRAYPVDCALAPEMSECRAVSTPAVGSAPRTAIFAAIHAQQLNATLGGQRGEIITTWIRTDGARTFVVGQLQGKAGTALDWSMTDYATLAASATFQPTVSALVETVAGQLTVTHFDVGNGEASWAGIWNNLDGASCALFPIAECELSDRVGPSDL